MSIKNKYKTLIIVWCLIPFKLSAQDIFQNQKANWLAIAEANKPTLISKEKRPISIVTISKDEKAFQGYTTDVKGKVASFYANSMRKQSGVILDFEKHLTGYTTFKIESLDYPADSPFRLKFTFAEVPSEAILPFDPYKGSLSRAWLQDEIVTVSEVPCVITIPRRVSFRYIKIEVLTNSLHFDFKLSDLYVKATTSAKTQPPLLAAETPDLIKKIDKVSVSTLKECMQTVYEDGPKRDRRLWVGDLYLESLANQYTFKNDSLTKHCLYLLAGLCYPDGVVPSNIFERPVPHARITPLFDYALIFNVVLKNYLLETGDKTTANDLWQVAKEQIKIPLKYIDDKGMVDYKLAGKEWWLFFDWKKDLDKQASLQGCVIWAYKNTYELAKLLGKENEVTHLPALITKMTKTAHQNLFDKKQSVFVSGFNKQISFASQAWMVLSGVASKKEGANAFKKLSQIKEVVYPGTPYLYHYVVEAMIKCGLNEEAKDVVLNYWGGMVEKGADTFWEVHDPKDDFSSPYNSFLVNSYCHAWSCTPTYFIRKYPEIFQKQTKLLRACLKMDE